jgi:hypothetical protein
MTKVNFEILLYNRQTDALVMVFRTKEETEATRQQLSNIKYNVGMIANYLTTEDNIMLGLSNIQIEKARFKELERVRKMLGEPSKYNI